MNHEFVNQSVQWMKIIRESIIYLWINQWYRIIHSWLIIRQEFRLLSSATSEIWNKMMGTSVIYLRTVGDHRFLEPDLADHDIVAIWPMVQDERAKMGKKTRLAVFHRSLVDHWSININSEQLTISSGMDNELIAKTQTGRILEGIELWSDEYQGYRRKMKARPQDLSGTLSDYRPVRWTRKSARWLERSDENIRGSWERQPSRKLDRHHHW
jgi:hypothetical protein